MGFMGIQAYRWAGGRARGVMAIFCSNYSFLYPVRVELSTKIFVL